MCLGPTSHPQLPSQLLPGPASLFIQMDPRGFPGHQARHGCTSHTLSSVSPGHCVCCWPCRFRAAGLAVSVGMGQYTSPSAASSDAYRYTIFGRRQPLLSLRTILRMKALRQEYWSLVLRAALYTHFNLQGLWFLSRRTSWGCRTSGNFEGHRYRHTSPRTCQGPGEYVQEVSHDGQQSCRGTHRP